MSEHEFDRLVEQAGRDENITQPSGLPILPASHHARWEYPRQE